MGKTVNFENGGFTFYHRLDESSSGIELYPHTHDVMELYYFVRGEASFCIEGSEYGVREGDLFIIRGGESHFLKLLSDKPYERFVLSFPKSFLGALDEEGNLTEAFYSRRLGEMNRFSERELDLDVLSVLTKMERADKGDCKSRLEIRLLLGCILLEINRAFERRGEGAYFKGGTELAAQITAYVNENIASDLSLDAVAARFFVSKSYLSRVFKDKTGYTLWRYVTLKRLLLAKEYILSGSGAARAAEAAGFNDYSAFYRQFVKEFGCPPTDADKTEYKGNVR